MKSLIPLYTHLLNDASRWCSASTTRDLETITRRSEHEGVSFFTITLPDFCKDFEEALALGQVTDAMFLSFSKHGALPKFLSGLLQRVFDLFSGRILEHPCVTSIYFVRQLTLVAKKIELPCTPERERKAFDAYVECEKEVHNRSSGLSRESLDSLARLCDDLWGRVLGLVDREVYELKHVPKHGPGATADKIRGNGKYVPRSWTRRLEENFFPSADFLIPNYGYVDDLKCVDYLEPGSEMPVKVISVPKTLKTPRIIAIEPAHMQYAQQSIMEILVRYLERDSLIGPLIGFTNQEPNQELARVGSLDGTLATIDLSEASDRVSMRLVTRVLRRFPSLMRAVFACRSRVAELPCGTKLRLRKFASMGSALCFPIEAMVFLSIVLLGIQDELMRPLRLADLRRLAGRVRVYGDDIVVPVEFAAAVIERLESFGLKINRRKTFATGKFRESCGKDWYDGSPVTPVYLRQPIPNDRHNAKDFSSFVSFRNQAYTLGLWETARWADEQIGRLAPFPVLHAQSSGLGRISFLGTPQGAQVRGPLQKPMVKAVVLVAKPPPSPLSGPWALMKFFLKRGLTPNPDEKHLERYGRPNSVDTKVRWVSVTP